MQQIRNYRLHSSKFIQSHMDLESTLGPWLGRTMKMMDYYFQDSFKKANINLTKQQWIVLKQLSVNDGIPQNELAYITERDKTSIARLISLMEKKNLVARIPSKTDKRINLIHLTTNGKQTFEQTYPTVHTIIKTLQKDLTPEEVESTIKVLKKIQSNLTNHVMVVPTTK